MTDHATALAACLPDDPNDHGPIGVPPDAVRATLVDLDRPNLGLATNRQLLDELHARIEVHWDLDYRTVELDGGA